MLSRRMMVPAVSCEVWPLSTDSSTTASAVLLSCCTCARHTGACDGWQTCTAEADSGAAMRACRVPPPSAA